MPDMTHASICLQTGTGPLTPNNPNSVASIVQYGYLPEKLEFTVTGAAEVCMRSGVRTLPDNPIAVGILFWWLLPVLPALCTAPQLLLPTALQRCVMHMCRVAAHGNAGRRGNLWHCREAASVDPMGMCVQIYSQVYLNFNPYNTNPPLGNTPYALNYSSPILHNAILSTLKPGTTYYYR